MGSEYDLTVGIVLEGHQVLKKTVTIKYSESIYMPRVLPLTHAFKSTLEITVFPCDGQFPSIFI